ncbi:unnamed protein product [Rotaria magnacalcarata]|uniref:Uncharacterized protein n=1 Tax=Rotaria magnacalcarata TaxID=392030 RepID=A0A815Q3V4_9BILA|nr:unnamed protein product [Rotaria magnacalcarata]CAF4132624.1 unnamed protein product [Rotaria magnacalcarata]
MSEQSPKSKYDVLLDKFLENDSLWEENECEAMKRWLNEAENNIRTQFLNHRGDSIRSSNLSKKDPVSNNTADHDSTAMCISLPSDSSDDDSPIEHEQVKKRPLDSCLFESESPVTKRIASNKSFFDDALGFELISLSSGLCSSPSDQSLGSINDDIGNKSNNLLVSSSFKSNMFKFNIPIEMQTCEKSYSILQQSNMNDILPKYLPENVLVQFNKSDEQSKNLVSNIKSNVLPSQLQTTTQLNNLNCIWPIGISYQPDFVEFVVTDEEMNMFWDTLKDSF